MCVFFFCYLHKQLGLTILPPRTRVMKRHCEGDSKQMIRSETEVILVVRKALVEVRAAHLGPLQVMQTLKTVYDRNICICNLITRSSNSPTASSAALPVSPWSLPATTYVVTAQPSSCCSRHEPSRFQSRLTV